MKSIEETWVHNIIPTWAILVGKLWVNSVFFYNASKVVFYEKDYNIDYLDEERV